MPTFAASSAASSGITNGYATLAELKARLDIPSGTTSWDAVLEACITGASRFIDNETNRVFYATTTTRYYTADDYWTLFILDDLLSVTTLKTVSSEGGGVRTYGYTWSATDYDLEPYDGPPYSRIAMNPTGLYSFPLTRRGVEVTGSFGYNATGSHPQPINEACLRQASRLFERNKAPLGMIGDGQISQATRYSDRDPDVMVLLAPYRRMELVGA